MIDGRRLRIGFRVGVFPRLSETFIISQVEGLLARGHEVSILADEPSDDPLAGELAGRVAGVKRVDYVHPHSTGLRRLHARLPFQVKRAAAAVKERRLCRENDVVVCNFGWMGAQVSEAVAGQSRRARIATVFHGDDMSRSLQGGADDSYAQLFREADLLLPVSEFWRSRLVELGAPEAKLRVHRMGVDLDALRFRAREPAVDKTFQLLTVGRLVEKKGTEFALRALRHLRSKAPDLRFRLRIVGDGPLYRQLVELRDALDLRDLVDFLGPQPHGRVAEALGAADGFLLPSVVASDGDMEGVPVALMEAMATGVPVVSTRHSGIPELIQHGVSGLLAAERDVVGLALQLEELIRDPAGTAAMARAARAAVEARFDRAKLDDEFEHLLYCAASGFEPRIATPDRPVPADFRPLVSVVIPTFNRANTLVAAVESVLAQTYSHLEVLIVDDGSTDDTAQIATGISDPRVRYIRKENGGVASARNRGMKEARGELIGFLDSDDLWLPEKLQRQIDLVGSRSERVGLFYTGAYTYRSCGPEFVEAPVHRGYVFEQMLQRNFVHVTNGVLIRREVIDTVGGFDESLPAIEDYEYWTRIARLFEFDYVREPLVVYNDQEQDSAERRSRNFQANVAAREIYAKRYACDAKRAGVYHHFLLESARRCMAEPGAKRTAVRLLLKAIRACPGEPRLYVWLGFGVLFGSQPNSLLPMLRRLRRRFVPDWLWLGSTQQNA